MSNVLLAFGNFNFSIHGAMYQSLKRSTSSNWVSVSRMGGRPVQQYIGQGEDTIKLEGVIFPYWRGGSGQLETMRALADTGSPQFLFGPDGVKLGRFCLTDIEESWGSISSDGVPVKQSFTLSLMRYPDDL